MKKYILLFFLSIQFLVMTSVLCMATEEVLNETPQGEVIVNEQLNETDENAVNNYKWRDDRIQAIEMEAQEKIRLVLEKINNLEDKSQEGELQKQIERIKLDAEIARFTVQKQDAENEGNVELAKELQNEINHLKTVNQPVYGTQDEQLRQYGVPASEAGGGKEGK